jgi:hypothetical protein
MPISLFRSTSNIASLGVCFLHSAILILTTFFIPLYFQTVLGASALLSGVWLLPLALSLSFSSAFTGALISKTGNYLLPIRVGFALAVLGVGLLYDLPRDKMWAKIIIYQVLLGFGIGPNFQALLLALQNQVEPKHYATATATFGFIRNLAMSIGIVVGNVVFQNSMEKKAGLLQATLGSETAAFFKGGVAESSAFVIERLGDAQKVIVRGAFYDSLRNVWITAVVLAAVGMISVAGIKGKELSKVHTEIKTGLGGDAMKRDIKEEGSSQV